MAQLHLVESDFENLEKRVLPRFPFCYLTFKCGQSNKVFEVRDISNSGMQLVLRDGAHEIKEGSNIHGQIHWNGESLDINAGVKWITDSRMGVEFSSQASMREAVKKFLAIDHFVSHLKPIHLVNAGVEIPAKLKYWLRSDGPVELFLWQHSNGDVSEFQVVIMESFIEWIDGEGLKTGRVISKRDVDTPLINEDEFVFKVDNHLDDSKIEVAKSLVNRLDASTLDLATYNFLRMKLGL